MGHIYAQTTIDETTPGHMLTRWAPPSTSNWSANAVGELKRLPPHLCSSSRTASFILVSRGFNGGLRPSSSALWCDRFFEHACYGKVGQHVHIITNDTKYRKNSTWKVYDWFGPTKFPRAGFATRTVDVLHVSNKEMEQYARSSGFLDGSVLTFVNWPEQSHLGHFMMVAGTQFEYADVLQKCHSKHALNQPQMLLPNAVISLRGMSGFHRPHFVCPSSLAAEGSTRRTVSRSRQQPERGLWQQAPRSAQHGNTCEKIRSVGTSFWLATAAW